MTLLGRHIPVSRKPPTIALETRFPIFGATLDGGPPLAPWNSTEVTLRPKLFASPLRVQAARCYLSLHGGIIVNYVPGQRLDTSAQRPSEATKAERCAKGDVLRLGREKSLRFRKKNRRCAKVGANWAPRKSIARNPWPAKATRFHNHLFESLLRKTHNRVAEESNRMGLRLEGPIP